MAQIAKIIILILLPIALGLSGCNEEHNAVPAPATTEPSSPMQVELSLPYAPALNQAADLTCTVSLNWDPLSDKADSDQVNAEVTIKTSRRLTTPESEYMTHPYVTGDNITRILTLKPDQPQSFSTQIVLKEIGIWTIEALATGRLSAESRPIIGGDVIYLTVSTEKGEFGWPPTGPVRIHRYE